MENELNLTLPRQEGRSKKEPAKVIWLLLLLIVISAANILLALGGWRLEKAQGSNGLTPEQYRQLALKLEKQSLNTAAARLWQQYLQIADLDSSSRAKIWYRIGKIHQAAGNYEKALVSFYCCEQIHRLDELSTEVGRRTQECLEALGKFAALRYELSDRVGLDAGQKHKDSEVVAAIGPQKITELDLDKKIEEQIEWQLRQFAAMLPDAARNQQKEQLLKKFSAPEMRLRLLEQMIIEEILYRRARELKLAQNPAVRSLLHYTEKSILAKQLLDTKIAEKINLTPGDVQTYYQANQQHYQQPECVKLSHIQVPEKKQAQTIIKQLAAGAKFADLARQFSIDAATKENGGEISGWLAKGDRIPGIGAAPEAISAIFAVAAGKIVPEPIAGSNGFHVVRVRQHQSQRQQSFAEVQQQVRQELLRQKQQEVQRALVSELKNRYQVVIYRNHFAKNKPDATSGSQNPQKPNKQN